MNIAAVKCVGVHEQAKKQNVFIGDLCTCRQVAVHVWYIREVVKTTILEQDPPNHKIVGGVCLHPPCLTSKDGVSIA